MERQNADLDELSDIHKTQHSFSMFVSSSLQDSPLGPEVFGDLRDENFSVVIFVTIVYALYYVICIGLLDSMVKYHFLRLQTSG